MFYRLKQFYWGVICSFKSIDYEFLKMYLNEEELNLFSKLKTNEMHHCIRVAKSALKFAEDIECNGMSKNYFIKACLLHDIGKIGINISIVDKSLLVIVDRISRGKIKKYNNIKKIDVYYNHPKIGYNILKPYGYSDEFLYLILNHHNHDIKDNKNLNILIRCDSIN